MRAFGGREDVGKVAADNVLPVGQALDTGAEPNVVHDAVAPHDDDHVWQRLVECAQARLGFAIGSAGGHG